MEGTASRLLFTMTTAMATVGFGAGLASADEHGQARMSRIPRLTGKIQIEGRLNDKIWKDAALCADFVLLDGTTRAKQPTEARVFHNDKGLYFGVMCRQPNLPVAEESRRDGDVYRDDSVEIFLDVGCKGEGYYHLLINVANVIRDEIGRDNTSWDAKARTGTVRRTDGWSCEIFIPFASIGLTKPADTPLGMNICRNDAGRAQSSSWAGATSGFHQPDEFGLALLSSRKVGVSVEILRIQPIGKGMSRQVVVKVRNEDAKPLVANVSMLRLDRGANVASKPIRVAAGQAWTGGMDVGLDKPGRYGIVVLVRDARGLIGGVRGKILISRMRH